MQFLSRMWQREEKPQASGEDRPSYNVVVLLPLWTPEEECEQVVKTILATTKTGTYLSEPTGYKRYLYYYPTQLGYALFAQHYELSVRDRRLARLVSTFNTEVGDVPSRVHVGWPGLRHTYMTPLEREFVDLTSRSVTVAAVEGEVHRYNEYLAKQALEEPDAKKDYEVPLQVDEYGVFVWYSKPSAQGIWTRYSYRGLLPEAPGAVRMRPVPMFGVVTQDGVWHQPGGKAGYVLALSGIDSSDAWTKEVDRIVHASFNSRWAALWLEEMDLFGWPGHLVERR